MKMKYIKLALFLLIAVSGFSQAVKLDSTVIYESRNIYNNAGYYIGKDSFHVKSVRWAYSSDTFYQRIDTLIERFPQRFITIDSLAPYLPIADFDEKAEDIIGTKLIEGSNITLTYNDATGETTVDASGASGLNAESVFDTVAYTLKVGEGLQKTKSDTGDSLLVELKLKDALERIVWSTGCHKMVFLVQGISCTMFMFLGLVIEEFELSLSGGGSELMIGLLMSY